MRATIKVIIAVLLIIASAGVVIFNIRFFTGSKKQPGAREEQSPLEGGSFEGAAMAGEALEPQKSELFGSLSAMLKEKLQGGPFDGEGEGHENGGSASIGSTQEDLPLGREWKNTLWHELLTSFVAQRQAEAPKGPAPLEADVGNISAAKKEAGEGTDWETPLESLQVRGIIRGESAACALISGRTFRPGDPLPGKGILVAEIGKNHVVFRCEKSGKGIVKLLEPRQGGSVASQEFQKPEEAGQPAATGGRGSEKKSNDREEGSGGREDDP